MINDLFEQNEKSMNIKTQLGSGKKVCQVNKSHYRSVARFATKLDYSSFCPPGLTNTEVYSHPRWNCLRLWGSQQKFIWTCIQNIEKRPVMFYLTLAFTAIEWRESRSLKFWILKCIFQTKFQIQPCQKATY